jgi:hypothetical protein
MYPTVQIDESILQSGLILLPRYAVHSGCSFSLQRIKAFPQQIDRQMVEQAAGYFSSGVPRYPRGYPPVCHAGGRGFESQSIQSRLQPELRARSNILSARCATGLLPNRRLLPANIFNLFFKRGFSEKCYSFPVGFLFHEEGSPLPAKIF